MPKDPKELSDEDTERIAKALASAKDSEKKAATASSSGFIKFLEKVGMRTLARIVADVIENVGWSVVKNIIDEILGWF